VEGTLASDVKLEPDQIPTMEGRMIPRKCAVKYVYLYLNGLYGRCAYYDHFLVYSLHTHTQYPPLGCIYTRTFHLKLTVFCFSRMMNIFINIFRIIPGKSPLVLMPTTLRLGSSSNRCVNCFNRFSMMYMYAVLCCEVRTLN
jgi:hypothetical protein